MAIALTVEDYMEQHRSRFEVLTHLHSRNSTETARLARVPAERLAKSVILEDDDGFLMAVLRSTDHLRIGALSRELNRNRLRLASEGKLRALFADCELGAIPPLGLAYGMRTMVDDRLAEQPDVYFEAGDHEKLIHMARDDFMTLLGHVGRGRFGEQM